MIWLLKHYMAWTSYKRTIWLH